MNTIVEHVRISTIYDMFKSSELYSNMSKLDKRKYSLKYFNEKIKTNIFLQHDYRKRDSRYNKIQLKADSIINYKIINIDDLL